MTSDTEYPRVVYFPSPGEYLVFTSMTAYDGPFPERAYADRHVQKIQDQEYVEQLQKAGMA